MKRILVWIIALTIALLPSSACASDGFQDIIDGILAYSSGESDMQNWLDGPVFDAIGSSMDNYIINLRRAGYELDYSACVQAAAEKVQTGDLANPVSRQRCALMLIACGALDRVPAELVDETVGKLGVMSYVFGLHLLNNGAQSEAWTCDTIVEKLLELQKQDGGWAVMGNYSDVDVTAMCLQALAAYKNKNEATEHAIELALTLLSEKQQENGGYISTGRENAESCCQVLIALASLGIDPSEDARFQKNGISVLDALLAYRLPSGGFGHQPGDEVENDTANVQALQALTALSLNGEAYFDFSSASESPVATNTLGWKLWAYIAIAVLALAGCIFALTRRRGRIKQLIFVILLAALAAGAVCFINVESASQYYSGETMDEAPVAGSVYLSIRCDTVAGKANDGSTPQSGVILERTEMPYSEGDSVFDILTDAARRFEIHMEHEGGTEGMAYVCGINHLYEYKHGELSGWMYSVNGDTPSIGCGSHRVNNGDEIIWEYTMNIGEDLK